MTRLPHYLTVCAGVGLIAVVLSLTAARPAVAQKGGGAAPVTIAGPLPLPVQETGTPFQATLCFATPGPCIGGTTDSLTVPTDVRVVIEFVSAECSAQAPSSPGTPEVSEVSLFTTVGTNVVKHQLQTGLITTGGTNAFGTFPVMTKIHADPGTDIELSFGFHGSSAACTLGISGYTIPVPSV